MQELGMDLHRGHEIVTLAANAHVRRESFPSRPIETPFEELFDMIFH
jgi:hypothetical protein